MTRAYKVVDAFSSDPFKGNPVAVVLDGTGLSDSQMQAIAGWTNLSETTFVLPPTKPQASYLLRIFTPLHELPFAGHPTLGSAHAVLEAGIVEPKNGKLVQECGAGLVDIDVEGAGANRLLTLSLPKAKVATLPGQDVRELEGILGTQIVWEAQPATVDVGPHWLIAQIPSVEGLLDLRPDMGRLSEFSRRLSITGVTAFAFESGESPNIEVRTFAPVVTVPEDPVCGSGNGSVAVFRALRGLMPEGGIEYQASQGRCVGRDGKIAVRIDASEAVFVGGHCVTTVDGQVKV
ncbi:PhzF family phenazine biosynthesis protein [Microvirga flavescens]|uniref:PhzF family phenazine biosynthesis protein n=1 Tax=Microvirga flavescens TaxID=2249811 RepID=UPI000DD639E8|nr:PhzF family phenazine biosynthesis protein [Microvirga flavescens]